MACRLHLICHDGEAFSLFLFPVPRVRRTRRLPADTHATLVSLHEGEHGRLRLWPIANLPTVIEDLIRVKDARASRIPRKGQGLRSRPLPVWRALLLKIPPLTHYSVEIASEAHVIRRAWKPTAHARQEGWARLDQLLVSLTSHCECVMVLWVRRIVQDSFASRFESIVELPQLRMNLGAKALDCIGLRHVQCSDAQL